jgi:hypothetical protein
MGTDAAACQFAEAIAEDHKHNHENERESFWEDACRKENGIEYSVSDDRCSENPKPVD